MVWLVFITDLSKIFSTLAAPLTGIVKKSVGFKWGSEQDCAFIEIKERLCGAPLLVLLDFSKNFEIECDASGIGIGAVLRKEKLYANLKKCSFCMDKVVFLGYVVSAKGIKVDEEWPTPKSITEVRSFHGLASFYQRFVKDFSSLAAPLIEIVKKSVGFKWGSEQDRAFIEIKERLCGAPLLALSNFSKTFEI